MGYTWKVLKCGSGKGWRSVGPIVREMEKCYVTVTEQRNMVRTIKERKANWIGHILRMNYLLKHVVERKIEGRIEVTEKRVRRRKQLLHNIKRILEIERGSTIPYSVDL
jgi:CTP-dependent riboflavin kinase